MIRPAKSGEGHIIWEIHSESIKGLCAGDYSEEQIAVWTDDTAESYERVIAKSPLCLVSETNGHIGGYVALRGNKSIWQLYVRPSHAGTGIGKALLGEVEKFLVSLGETRAVAEASLTAVGFYGRCGYSLKSSTKVMFGGIAFDAIEVEKLLAAG